MSLYYITMQYAHSVIILVQFCMQGILAGSGFSLFNHLVFDLKYICMLCVGGSPSVIIGY